MATVSVTTTIEGDIDLEAWADAAMKEAEHTMKERSLPKRTGRLYDSLHIVKDENTYSAVSDVEYASFIEFGTPTIPARLMATNTLDELPQILERHRDALKKSR